MPTTVGRLWVAHSLATPHNPQSCVGVGPSWNDKICQHVSLITWQNLLLVRRGVFWTIEIAFVVHTLCALRVMLDQWFTRARRPTALGSPQVPWEQVEAARIGLPWPSPKLSRRKPSRAVQWQRLLYREIRAGRPLAQGLTAQPPSSWQPDLGLRGGDVQLHDLEQVSVKRESVDSSLGPRVKRQKVHLERFVKDWFIDFADLQKSKYSWTWLRCFQEAQRFSPDVFGSVHRVSTRRWKHSRGQDEGRTCGRPTTLCAAHLTLLCQVVAKVSSVVGVSSTTYQFLFRIELSEIGIAWTPSSPWTRQKMNETKLTLTSKCRLLPMVQGISVKI